jgi:hypothetical protein
MKGKNHVNDRAEQQDRMQQVWRRFYAGDLPPQEASEMQRTEERLDALEKARLQAATEIQYRKADAEYMRALLEAGYFKVHDPRKNIRDAELIRALIYP